jgi:hypothetical protein
LRSIPRSDSERFAKAPKLKLIITAGIGSDHTDLEAANKHGVTVAEVTYSNSISVAEHVVMMILGLVRNYIPSHDWVRKGGWNIADCVERAYDLDGMHVGTAFQLTDEGWTKLTLRWALFFFVLAGVNEFFWRGFTTDTWIASKMFVSFPATMVFAFCQIPLLVRTAR